MPRPSHVPLLASDDFPYPPDEDEDETEDEGDWDDEDEDDDEEEEEPEWQLAGGVSKDNTSGFSANSRA